MTSNFLNPDYLKIGASMLSSMLIILSILESKNKPYLNNYIDLIMCFLLILSFLEDSVD